MSSLATALRNPGKIFYGWRVLAIISVIAAIHNGFYSKGAALFLLPVEASLQLSRASSSLIFSLARSEGAIEGPLIGYMVDRFGTRKMMLVGTILTGVGFLVFASATKFWVFAVAYLAIISLGATMAFSHSTNAMVNNWFSRYRVRALAIDQASGSLGSMIIVPVIGLVIAIYSWQHAAVIAAVLYLGLVLPLTRVLKEKPENLGLLPDGTTPEEVASARKAAAAADSPDAASARRLLRHYDAIDFTLGEALRSPSYWFLLGGTMFRQMAKAVVQVHIIAILVWKGQEPAQASLLFALWLGMNVPAKLVFGYFGDRVSKRVILSGGMVLYTVAMVVLLASSSVWLLITTVVMIGLAEGITPINWAAVGDYFGRRYFATLRGIMTLSYSWASVLVPFGAGWWFDQHGSYETPLVFATIASVLAVVVYAMMRRPSPPTRKAPSRRDTGLSAAT